LYIPIDGVCTSKDCKGIFVDGIEGDSYRCGKRCVYDGTQSLGSECQSNCPSGYINSSGICVVEGFCENQTPSNLELFPCTQHCFKNSSTCVSVCPSEYHDIFHSGICSYVSCDDNGSVIPNISSRSCDFHCLFDDFDNKCHSECSNKAHYEIIDNSRCEKKFCNERDVNTSLAAKCGSDDCLYDNSDGFEKCSKSCSNSNHYSSSTDNTFSCTLKPCASRTSNFSDTNPCGNDCFLDIYNGFQCKTDCLNENFYSKDNGICVLKDCESRTPDLTLSTFPCGVSNNCFLDVDSSNDHKNVCVSHCFNEKHYEPINGKCVLKSCVSREKDNSLSFPCGSEDCFEDQNNFHLCKISCMYGEHYRG
jgi:hypothetical protein